MIVAEIVTRLSGGPSLVWIFGRLDTFDLYVRVSNIISNFALSPTGSTFLSKGALVHPQPGTTFRILRSSSPVESSQKSWVILECCGTNPKSNEDSAIVSRGALVAIPASTRTEIRINNSCLIVFIIYCYILRMYNLHFMFRSNCQFALLIKFSFDRYSNVGIFITID